MADQHDTTIWLPIIYPTTIAIPLTLVVWIYKGFIKFCFLSKFVKNFYKIDPSMCPATICIYGVQLWTISVDHDKLCELQYKLVQIPIKGAGCGLLPWRHSCGFINSGAVFTFNMCCGGVG